MTFPDATVQNLGYSACPWRIVTDNGCQIVAKPPGWLHYGYNTRREAEAALTALQAGTMPWSSWDPADDPPLPDHPITDWGADA